MQSDPVLARIQAIGRAGAWLVIAILSVAALYAAYIAVVNWGPIGV